MTVDSHPATARIDRDELLSRVDLAHVMDALAHGHGNGRLRRWRCPEPDHPDLHPSVTMSIDKHGVERWRCWSGGHGGTAIDADIAAHHLGVGDAIRWLNDHYAHLEPLSRQPRSESLSRPVGNPSSDVIEYVEHCENLLWTRSGTEIRSWLRARGLADDVLVANRVGADPGTRYLARRKGLPHGALAAVFPALDRSGNITYFQSRFIDPTLRAPKYANPARHLASNPGLAWTQPVGPCASRGPLVVTEGIPDALIAAGAGMRSVGVLGSMTPNNRNITHLVRGATERDHPHPSIVVCFDADPPGRTGAERLIKLLNEQTNMIITDVSPPDGMDLTDWSAFGADWTNHLASAPHRTQCTEPNQDFEIDFGP